MFIRVVLLFFFFFILQTHQAFAHLAGQPPFFKINDEYSALYPVQVSSVSDMVLPQDIAVKPHVVNETLSMVIEPEFLPIPSELIEKTRFTWEFGDGAAGEGLEQTHTYTAPGSYIAIVYADFSAVNEKYEPQLIQSTLIHVLPDKSYRLPHVFVKVNEIIVRDPLVDSISLKSPQNVALQAMVTQGTTNVTSITWDLSDAKIATGEAVTHTYPTNRQYYFPYVRVIDANGFIVDAYAELYMAQAQDVTNDKTGTPFLVIGIVLGIIGFIFVIWKRKFVKN